MERRKARHSASHGSTAPNSVNGGWWTHRYARDFCALCIGVAVGSWLTTQYLLSDASSSHPLAQSASQGSVNNRAPAADYDWAEPVSSHTTNSPSQSLSASASTSGESPSDTSSHQQDSQNPPSNDDSALEEFLAHINAGRFSAAMDVYLDLDAREPTAIPPLREALLNQLKIYLAGEHNALFKGLSDAVLAAYFNDIEVLTLVADFHAQNDELAEALDSFQLAKSFIQRSGDERIVQERLSRFVQHTVSYLSNKNDWFAVQTFLETLLDRVLSTPEHEVLLAEVYFYNGYDDSARLILEKHKDTPSVKHKVAKLLAKSQQGEEIVPVVTGFDAVVNMEKRNAHYLVPLRAMDRVSLSLLLDTGASITTVSKRKMDEIRSRYPLRYRGYRMFNTANGVARARVYEVERIKIGPYVLDNVELSEMDLPNASDFDGLLGMNVLGQFHFQIDQIQSDLLLTPRK